MLKSIFNELFPIKAAHAHCDIPCGIYDPHAAQVAAHTVIRMTNLLSEVKNEPDDNTADFKIARYTRVKEDHAEIVKREIVILWGDYFKEEHLKEFPTLTEAVHHTLKLASKAKQNIDIQAAQELLEHVHEIAEIFYKSKGLTPIKVKSAFPTEGEIVVHK